jgi:hypothetical protein
MDDSPSYDNTDKDSDSDLDSLYDAIKEHDDIRYRYPTTGILFRRVIFAENIEEIKFKKLKGRVSIKRYRYLVIY